MVVTKDAMGLILNLEERLTSTYSDPLLLVSRLIEWAVDFIRSVARGLRKAYSEIFRH